MGRSKKAMDQLSIDASNALKAGMSYGKYMATKKQTSATVPVQSGYKHTCPICGNEFVTNTKNARKYCSDECKQNAVYKRKRQYPKPRVCDICGKEFMATHWRSRYCSEFCLKVGQSERVKECLARKKEAKSNG